MGLILAAEHDISVIKEPHCEHTNTGWFSILSELRNLIPEVTPEQKYRISVTASSIAD
jgi:hypothetical protein